MGWHHTRLGQQLRKLCMDRKLYFAGKTANTKRNNNITAIKFLLLKNLVGLVTQLLTALKKLYTNIAGANCKLHPYEGVPEGIESSSAGGCNT